MRDNSGVPASGVPSSKQPGDSTRTAGAAHTSKPPSKLGAGGASAIRNDTSKQDGDSGVSNEAGTQEKPGAPAGLKAALAAGVVAGVTMLANMVLLAMVAKLLKALVMQAAAIATNMVQMLISWALGVAQSAASAVLGVGAAVSSAVGGAVSAATAAAMMVTGGGVAIAAAASVVVASNASEQLMRSDGQIQCQPVIQRTLEHVSTEPGSLKAAENAERIYSVFAAWGMPDENIAGILGNWDAESEIDPTGVETIFDEKHRIGPRKQEAWDLQWDIAEFDPEYAVKYPAIDKMGIGLGQWTNGRNTLLTNYADSIDEPWYDIETQLGFMMSHDDPVRVAYMQDLLETSRGSVEEATLDFKAQWEGLSDASAPRRVEAAEHWMAMFGSWEVDDDLADSILDQAGTTVDTANQQRAADLRAQCQDSATAVAAGDAHYSGEISSDGWAEPTETMHVTSLWGPRNHPGSGQCRSHDGLDLDGNYGDPYFAAHDGLIRDLEWTATGGWTLTLELSDGSGFLKYLHTNSTPESASGTPEFFVSVGDEVKAGDHLGNIGNTGLSFGAHLHFEIHEADSTWVGWPQGWSGTINPKTFLEDQGFTFTGVQGVANTCASSSYTP